MRLWKTVHAEDVDCDTMTQFYLSRSTAAREQRLS
jgi:hypothetical protein